MYASNGSETVRPSNSHDDDSILTIVLQTNPVFLSYVNSATAYVNGTTLFGNGVSGLQSSIMGQIDDYSWNAGPNPNVVAGYKAIYSTTANDILTSPIGLVEILIGNNVDGVINIGAALQHPYSQGQITINSSNPMDYPVINPNYLSHPAGKLLPADVGVPFETDTCDRHPSFTRGYQTCTSPGRDEPSKGEYGGGGLAWPRRPK